jgi:hypothetical protein
VILSMEMSNGASESGLLNSGKREIAFEALTNGRSDLE